MTRRPRIACAWVSLAVFAAGCGTSDDGAKAAFITQANAVCRAGNAKLATYSAEIAAAQTSSDESAVFARLAALTRKAASDAGPFLDRLDAIPAPGEDRDALKKWIADGRRQQTLVARLAGAFATRNQSRVATLSEQIDALDQAGNAFARRYGMRECGKDAG